MGQRLKLDQFLPGHRECGPIQVRNTLEGIFIDSQGDGHRLVFGRVTVQQTLDLNKTQAEFVEVGRQVR